MTPSVLKDQQLPDFCPGTYWPCVSRLNLRSTLINLLKNNAHEKTPPHDPAA